jgi:hypothetical protein
MYGFFVRRFMGYGISGVMGYELQFPANQLGNGKILWGIRDYGLSELWVKRASTVLDEHTCLPRDSGSSLCPGPWALVHTKI